jgi:hypothetical protein
LECIEALEEEPSGAAFAPSNPEGTMTDPKKPGAGHESRGRRDGDRADERPQKSQQRSDYTAGANGDQDVDASAAERAENLTPHKDGTGW